MYWIMSILGLVLMIIPFVLGFSANSAATGGCILLGLVVALSADTRRLSKTKPTGKWSWY